MQTLFTKSKREKNHSDRVGLLSEAISRQMNLSNEEVNRIRVAGFLHDIRKIGIDEAILNKTGKLDESEWEIMKRSNRRNETQRRHAARPEDCIRACGYA